MFNVDFLPPSQESNFLISYSITISQSSTPQNTTHQPTVGEAALHDLLEEAGEELGLQSTSIWMV